MYGIEVTSDIHQAVSPCKAIYSWLFIFNQNMKNKHTNKICRVAKYRIISKYNIVLPSVPAGGPGGAS